MIPSTNDQGWFSVIDAALPAIDALVATGYSASKSNS